MKRPTGRAFNKAESKIYTWWDDGSLSFHVVGSVLWGDTRLVGEETPVVPPVAWNADDFLMFVPVAVPEGTVSDEWNPAEHGGYADFEEWALAMQSDVEYEE